MTGLTAFDVYLIGIATDLSIFICISALSLLAFSILYYILACDNAPYGQENDIKFPYRYFILSIFMFFIAAIIPSSKTLAAMYAVPYLTSQEDIKEIPASVAKIINNRAKGYVEYIEEGEED